MQEGGIEGHLLHPLRGRQEISIIVRTVVRAQQNHHHDSRQIRGGNASARVCNHMHVQPGLVHGRRLAEECIAIPRRHQHLDSASAEKRVAKHKPRGEGGHLRVVVNPSTNSPRRIRDHGRGYRVCV